MARSPWRTALAALLFAPLALIGLSHPNSAHAAQVTLDWLDNASDEDGFAIERKTGTAGTYAQITTVGANITSYIDATVSTGTTYCYRVSAFNGAGYSAYSNEACNTVALPPSDTTPPPIPGTPVLTLLSSDTTGVMYSVTWSASIDQPSGTPVPSYSYTAAYNDGTAPKQGAVATTALALTMAYHSSGTAQGASVCVTAVDAAGNRSTGAACNGFTVPAPTTYSLTIAKVGSGTGTVAGTGITCGTDCTETVVSGTTLTLSATPATDSTFNGWSGGGCSGTGTCSVTVAAGTTVTATFNTAPPPSYTLTVAQAGTGGGMVTSNPAGIACNATCSATFPANTQVSLTATPATGSIFAGWSDGPCSGSGTCTLTPSSTTTGVTATFTLQPGGQTTEIVTAGGPGDQARVRGFTAAGVPTTTDFLAYAPEFTGGLFVALGRIPGLADLAIVTGTGSGRAAEVRIFRPDNSDTGVRFYPYGSSFTGGVRVAVCDLEGDGSMEIVTAPGAGRFPTVTVWTVSGTTVTKRVSFSAAPNRHRSGVFVACGDVDGDGVPEIVTGLDAGGSAEVAVFSIRGNKAVELASFQPQSGFTGGIRVAVADLDGDDRAEVLTALGPGGEPLVQVFSVLGSAVTDVGAFYGHEATFTGGLFVAGGTRDNNGRGRAIVSLGPGAQPLVRVFGVVGTALAELGEFLGGDPASLDGATVGAAQ